MALEHGPMVSGNEDRILILPATTRDGDAIQRLFRSAAIQSLVCANVPSLCEQMSHGLGGAIVAQEQLQGGADGLNKILDSQPSWSDIPVIVLAPRGPEITGDLAELASRHNFLFVQRPTELRTFLSTVKSVIRDRRRQYIVRDQLLKQQQHSTELATADRRKDEFLAVLAHELRNPLSPIRTGIDYLLAGDADDHESKQDILPMMSRQVNQMVRLIDDLLDVSRISRGKLRLQKTRIELCDVIRAALETAKTQIEGGQHHLRVTLPDTPIWLNADAVRLAQVFSNLLNNSAKYTDPGGQIEVRAEANGNEVSISVSDTGVGIPADMLNSVFDMFTQIGSSLERSRGGLGLGLTLVKTLVELHGGSITAASSGLGQGSQFTVTLPVADAQQSTRSAEQIPSYGGRPLRIVIADDNFDAAATLASLLKRLGHSAEVVHDGQSAVDAVCRLLPDVAIIDIGMPVLNGYEVAAKLRTCLPAGNGVHLAALSGWGQNDARQKAVAAGFDTHLVKPIAAATLVTLLQQAAEK
jgi:signal transduction histidine kinase